MLNIYERYYNKMLNISNAYHYYLYTKVADMRKNFDGLCGIVENEFDHKAISGDVFIFINRRRSQIKLLHWQGDGFAIYYKRLEKGTYEMPPIHQNGIVVKLKAHELVLILEGISLLSVRRRVRYEVPVDKK
jgi:transposase